ncbi:MAG: hypothetical protein R3F19_32105 [Verrucomicrobiales bacterium]
MKTMNLLLSVGAFAIAIFALCPAGAQNSVSIWHEQAEGPAGPWERVDPGDYATDANGNPVVPTDSGHRYFRTRIGKAVETTPPQTIPLEKIPTSTLEIASTHLISFADGDADGPGWSDAMFAPMATPVYEPYIGGVETPAYLEIKIVPRSWEGGERGSFPRDLPDDSPPDLGYILVSLTEQDFPIAEFATEGRTPCEELAEKAGTNRFKAVRFGATFYAAEGANGELLANSGVQPIKPDPAMLKELTNDHVSMGDDDTGVLEDSPHPALSHEHYESYADFKEDYQNNPVYQFLNLRRQRLAQMEWDVTNGKRPPLLIVTAGRTELFFEGERVESFRLVAEDLDPERLASIAPGRAGGLQIDGNSIGHGNLEVRISDKTTSYVLQIVDDNPPPREPRDNFVPGWQPAKYSYAGAWKDQPRHYQIKKNDLCRLMGCGPVAWSIYFVWVERMKNVKGAFGKFDLIDGSLSQTVSNSSTLVKEQRELHDLCDVICSPFGDSGATWPPDMTEGGLSYSWISALTQMTKRSWHIGWTSLDPCPPSHGLYCRDAIKGGYVAPVGLGWLWHYGVAYGYAYQEFKFSPNTVYSRKRFLKCNMGWKDSGPRWYNLCDTFWGANLKIWNGPHAP